MTTAIASCSTTTCAFNNEGCTALGITVAGDSTATCATFTTIDVRAGRPADGSVGACHRLECTHNKDLLCTNSTITITGENAECGAYEVA